MKIKTLKLEGNRFITENDQDDTIGEIKEDGTVVKEYFGQGLIYKNFKNFEQKSGPCYIAEYQGEKGTGFHDNIVDDELKTKNFNDMVEGEDYETYDTIIKQVKDEYARRNQKVSEQTIEDTAKEVFYEVDWQYISSLLDEWLDAEVDEVEYAVNIKNKETNEFIYQYDVFETYAEAEKSAKTIDLKDDEIYEIVEIKYDENGDELGINTITDSTLEECNSLKKESKQYKFDGTDTFPKKIKARGGYVFSKVNDGTYENAFIPVYMNERGDETLMTQDDFNHCEVLEEKEVKVTENSHKVNMVYTPIVEHKVITNRARKLKESLSQNEEDAIYSAGDFGELLDTLDGMKQDAKVQRARNLTSHAYTHIPDEEEDERLDEIKDEVISILTESYENGWKPETDLYERDIEAIANNLGISKYEVQKEADAIKFRYNGKVYFAEPVSMYQVDVFDDNHNKIGYGVSVDKIKEEVFTDFNETGYLYELVGGEYAGTYTREEAEKLPIKEPELSPDDSEIRNNGGFTHRKELDNQLQFKGYLGPMWNGTKDGKGVIRYETQQVYNQLSK